MITVSTGSQDRFNSMFFVEGMSGDQHVNYKQIKGSNEAISYITSDDVWV